MTRTYDRTHREAQARQTRAAILEAALALVGDDDDGQLTFARVAERAGVSEPTVYRNFPNREALIAALSEHVTERLRGPRVPDEPDELPAAAIAVSQLFAENPQLLRAAVRNRAVHEIREHGRKGRAARMRELLTEPTAHLEKKDAEAIKALFTVVLRGDTWLELTDRHRVDAERAGFAIAWGVRAMLEALRRDRTKGVRTLADEKLRARATRLRDPKNGRGE